MDAPLTDYQACIKDQNPKKPGSAQGFSSCNSTSHAHTFNPPAGIADGAAAQVIAGDLTATQLAAYNRGETLIVVSTIGFDLTGPDPRITLTKMTCQRYWGA